ncbi:glycogen debranching protein GlgX [Aquipuribacter nitratireducens]|uniref:Glycogen debranching protein GlgX n=1 Tax=Aquipuribacter nitratireducens TaxID=650104 RepID=A0ABW0GKS9_9MICO
MLHDASAPPLRATGNARPFPLGVVPGPRGSTVAVVADHADAVEVCVVRADPRAPGGRREHRVRLPGRTGTVHHGWVEGLLEGDRYVLRAHGPWEPAAALRYNPAKALVDPYARALDGPVRFGASLFDHVRDHGRASDVPSPLDSLGDVPFGVVTAPLDAAGVAALDAGRPRTPWSRTVVLEAHVRGLTMRHPGVPGPLRGTYAGLAHPAVVEHLLALGVTAVELLPVHASTAEPGLAERGGVNYWGYSTLSFHAPEPRYSAAVRAGGDAAAAVEEFRDAVRTLHAAGLEVWLDVVYNHTCEGGDGGTSLSFRGLDNALYYRTAGARYLDVTGTGNTLDLSHPEVTRLALDSLRYWVREMGVDGFRFDLAPALARRHDDDQGVGGFDRDHPFLVAARTDPVLRDVKLVTEPWDVGPYGWRTGQFPVPFADWNDRFRDGVRAFWLEGSRAELEGRPGPGVRDLATRLAGSEDVFGGRRRGGSRDATASVNFVTAHDGFTLADLVSFDRKHNEANGEDNRDGHGHNLSWNHGHEGATDDPAVLLERRRSLRALLGTLLLSAGVPMLLAGDELGRTQLGNNNGYCLDDPTTWTDWDLQPWQRDLVETTRFLVGLRAAHPVLRQDRHFGDRPRQRPDGTRDIGWFDGDGEEVSEAAWADPWRRTLLAFLNGDGVAEHLLERDDVGDPVRAESFLVVVHGGAHPREVQLPEAPWAAGYRRVWSSVQERPSWPTGPGGHAGAGPADLRGGERVTVESRSLTLLRVVRS